MYGLSSGTKYSGHYGEAAVSGGLTVITFEITFASSVHLRVNVQIGEEKATVIGLMRKAIAQQFTDEVST